MVVIPRNVIQLFGLVSQISFSLTIRKLSEVIYNENAKLFLSHKGSETEMLLGNWRNLHYFEYGKEVRVFTDADRELLELFDELYARKFTTEKSTELLDYLENANIEAVQQKILIRI